VSKIDIAALIPHAGSMCLLDDVIEWDATTIRCVSRTHRASNNPMRVNGQLPAACGIEYAAQAMAVHGGLIGNVEEKPRLGYLASVRDVTCRRKRLDDIDGDLMVRAEQLMGDGSRVIYQVMLSVGEVEGVSGRATVVLDAERVKT